MFSVQVRSIGDGVWRAVTLPLSTQSAQVVAEAAQRLKIGDQVQTVQAGAGLHLVDRWV